jgi:hypothetical protein
MAIVTEENYKLQKGEKGIQQRGAFYNNVKLVLRKREPLLDLLESSDGLHTESQTYEVSAEPRKSEIEARPSGKNIGQIAPRANSGWRQPNAQTIGNGHGAFEEFTSCSEAELQSKEEALNRNGPWCNRTYVAPKRGKI